MPWYGQYSRLKKGFLAVIFAGSTLGAGYFFYHFKSRVDGLEVQVENLTGVLDHQLTEDGKRIDALETKVGQPGVQNNDGVYAVLDATVQVEVYDKDLRVGEGSGFIIESKENDDGLFDNYVLSAGHCVPHEGKWWPSNDPSAVFPMEIVVYKDLVPQGSFDVKILGVSDHPDLSLLYFESTEKYPVVVIADEKRLVDIQMLSPVYTVGCPSGVPPIKTDGLLHAKTFFVNSNNYWLMTTLVSEGNSGGGVYLARTNEVIGVLGMSGVKQIGFGLEIPIDHLALMTPLTGVREWLSKQGFEYRKPEK